MVKRSILLVEDDEELRDILEDILENAGYCVVPAGNGKQALDFLRATPSLPDLVVMDLMLPILSGWECLQTIRSDARLAALPVLVLTAMSRDRPHGATALLKKPVSLSVLLETVRLHALPRGGDLHSTIEPAGR